MAIKDLLKGFAKEAGGLAFPSETSIIIESFGTTTVQQWREYIPPESGFLVIFAEGTDITVECARDGGLQQLSANSYASWGKASIACTRGIRIRYAVWGSSIKHGACYFVPARFGVQ